jgi:murein DD-endopeptidase MepM/ murein hydrolase activator NlpD
MTITYTPELGDIPVTTTTKMQTGVLNAPPAGTPIRATLGDTVIVGKTVKGVKGHPVMTIRIDAPYTPWGHTLDMQLWFGAGWVIELTEEATS